MSGGLHDTRNPALLGSHSSIHPSLTPSPVSTLFPSFQSRRFLLFLLLATPVSNPSPPAPASITLSSHLLWFLIFFFPSYLFLYSVSLMPVNLISPLPLFSSPLSPPLSLPTAFFNFLLPFLLLFSPAPSHGFVYLLLCLQVLS